MKSAAIGFAFGLLLLPLFLAIGGAGHGLFFPLYFVSAPFSVIPEGILFVPVLASLLAWSATNKPQLFLFLIALHYVAAILIGLRTFHDERDNSSFHTAFAYLGRWIVALRAAYFVGQLVLWVTYALSKREAALLHAQRR